MSREPYYFLNPSEIKIRNNRECRNCIEFSLILLYKYYARLRGGGLSDQTAVEKDTLCNMPEAPNPMVDVSVRLSFLSLRAASNRRREEGLLRPTRSRSEVFT